MKNQNNMIQKLFITAILSCFILLINAKKIKSNESSFQLAFLKEIYIDKSENEESKGEKEIRNFIGLFPKKNDTITIFKVSNLNETQEKSLFWIKSDIKKECAILYCSSSNENIKVSFKHDNKIKINDDIYTANNEYFIYLKKKILNDKSILDLVYFLKDGYGDYSQSLELLNKNWSNYKQNTKYRIISAIIKNKDQQTDNKYFIYRIKYIYDKRGTIKDIIGGNSFNKKFISENKKTIHYSIDKSINERSQVKEDLYINKINLFDSIVGNYEQYSTSRTFYYTKFQSLLKIVQINTKPKSSQEIFKLLNINEEILK
ncbi:hypothetical protein RB619_19220 [Flavobacterium sp. LHD-80]|uniref:hypothetical protein n=1 Tax=Flavobacterium sp. LHD-80 TaxID=3071411 RepID=UPI0027E0421B|nr:hypothetical protein [Flavobacterium sp. LHD-80]MDQ6472776.1 hypothetical protein [Flavobacterium sp. LHD-80]